jgi:predicted nucleic acid-binding protein
LKIVTDASVLIRAHKRSWGLARRLLYEILERGHRLVLSNEMIAEAVKVLRYPAF